MAIDMTVRPEHCEGSLRQSPSWPGDSDRCPWCGRWCTTRQDGRIPRHRKPKNPERSPEVEFRLREGGAS